MYSLARVAGPFQPVLRCESVWGRVFAPLYGTDVTLGHVPLPENAAVYPRREILIVLFSSRNQTRALD